jgi:hypothetical protein
MNTYRMFMFLVRTEGVGALYRGLVPGLALAVPNLAVWVTQCV